MQREISLVRFENGDVKSFQEAVLKIKDAFDHQDEIDVNFFPSSTLASVYLKIQLSLPVGI